LISVLTSESIRSTAVAWFAFPAKETPALALGNNPRLSAASYYA
jgi:hypothetical protein